MKAFNDISHQQTNLTADNRQNLGFVPFLIHEIKNQLNAIIGFSHIIKNNLEKPDSKEDCLECIADIEEVAEDLNEMLGDLLYSFKKKAFKEFGSDLTCKINVEEVIKKAIKINQEFAQESKVSIKLETDNLPEINLDKRGLKQIMINLINNAIKYSPDDTVVRIKSFVKKNKLLIIVSDQGCGIASDRISNIFKKFSQNTSQPKAESFGIGLYVVKKIVRSQNGQIKVRSQLGKGSEFILEFKIQQQGQS